MERVPGGGQWSDWRSGAALDGDFPSHRRGGQGRPVPVDGSRSGWTAVEGRVLEDSASRQYDGRSAEPFRVGGDARGARGGHGGKTRRTGGGEGRGRHLERPY